MLERVKKITTIMAVAAITMMLTTSTVFANSELIGLEIPQSLDMPQSIDNQMTGEDQADSEIHYNNIEKPEVLEVPDGNPINTEQEPMYPADLIPQVPTDVDPFEIGIDRPEEADLIPAININDYKWDLTQMQTQVSLNMNRGITRFEVFYSAGAPLPEIIFMDPSGNYYKVGIDDDLIETKAGNQVQGHSDIRYAVVYIKSPSVTDGWHAQINVDNATHEFLFAKTIVPVGWADLKEEYRTEPQELILWGLKHSEYDESGLFALIENVDYKPESNGMGTAAPPEPPKTNWSMIITVAFVMTLFAIGGLIIFNNWREKQIREQKKAQRISRRNSHLQKRQGYENSHLDQYLKDEDYSDDAFFKENPAVVDNVEDLRIPVEKKAGFIEEEPDEDELRRKPRFVPEPDEIEPKEEKKPELPSWLTD